MSHPDTFRSATLALILASTCGIAAAEGGAFATARISNVQLHFVDLDPLDGYTPLYWINRQSNHLSGRISGTNVPGGGRYELNWLGPDPQYLTAASGTSSIEGNVTGVPGEIDGSLAFLSSLGAGSAETSTATALRFGIGPGTGLRVTGTVFASADKRDADNLDATMDAYATVILDYGHDYDEQGIGDFGDGQPDQSRDFVLGFDNTTDEGKDLGLHFYAWTRAHSNGISPVPEPAGYAMLGAGFALLAARARMRRRHA